MTEDAVQPVAVLGALRRIWRETEELDSKLRAGDERVEKQPGGSIINIASVCFVFDICGKLHSTEIF